MRFAGSSCFVRALVLLLCVPAVSAATTERTPPLAADLTDKTAQKIEQGKRLNRRERREVKNAEKAKYIELRQKGFDEVSNTKEAAALRSYRLRSKKRYGVFRKKEKSLADVLFPGVAPEEYESMEPIAIYADLVESRKNPVPYEYYDLPFCPEPQESKYKRRRRERKNLGSRLQGHDLKVAPFDLRVKSNKGCTVICNTHMDTKTLKWMRNLVKAQYRVQLMLDRLPVLMRSKEYNYAVRGYPVGFQAPASFQELETGEYYLFNHLKFIVTYHEDPTAFEGTRIVGFDVHPVSIQHASPNEAVDEKSEIGTCDGSSVFNEPSQYLQLKQKGNEALQVVYSYEVEWVESDLTWADRWDVYLIGAPDDDLHYFSIVNSLMSESFLRKMRELAHRMCVCGWVPTCPMHHDSCH